MVIRIWIIMVERLVLIVVLNWWYCLFLKDKIFEKLKQDIGEKSANELKVLGGGKVLVDFDKKQINVFGESQVCWEFHLESIQFFFLYLVLWCCWSCESKIITSRKISGLQNFNRQTGWFGWEINENRTRFFSLVFFFCIVNLARIFTTKINKQCLVRPLFYCFFLEGWKFVKYLVQIVSLSNLDFEEKYP